MAARSLVLPLLALLLLSACAINDEPSRSSAYFPGEHWGQVADLDAAGWSTQKLEEAQRYAATLDTAAVVIVERGRIVRQWGDVATKFNVHSIRKSFLSALYGIAVRDGAIDLDVTLQALDIDDNPPSLTALEKTARVRDLLKARSGIYHPTLYESADMIARKPPRGSHPPRSFWVYNNWDFNTLGTIFNRRTGGSLFDFFQRNIALPLEMEDFKLEDTGYVTGDESIHPAYPFRMSARDMARFGLLFARQGMWRGKQLIPSEWVEESTTAYSVAEGDAEYGYSGYGYMWWVAVNGNHFPGVELPDGSFSARGVGGHFIVVIPQWDLVVVHRVNTDIENKAVSLQQFGRLLNLVLAASQRAPR